MNRELLEQLLPITEEEQEILDKQSGVKKSIYTSKKSFVIECDKMLERGKLIDVRTHTRFVHFPEHSHNYIEIIYMCAGSTTHIINGKDRVVLKEGELLFLNQNAKQEILPAKEGDIAINFIVLPEFFHRTFEILEDENVVRNFIVGTLQQKKQGMDYIHFEVADVLPIQNLVENLVWSLVNKQPNRRNVNQTTMALLILQLSYYTQHISDENPNQYEKQMMLSVLRYVEEHYKDGTLTELSMILNQSVSGLSRFIKKQSGETFQSLLMQKRMNQSAFLLTTTRLSVEDIIRAVGYDNTSYFHRIFKKTYGMTPKKYRDLNQKVNIVI